MGGNATVNDTERQGTYWRRTSGLMWLMLFLWIFFSFVVHWAVKGLNEIVIMGFPLGFYMAAQGSLIAFVLMLFFFASRQDSIDRDTGMAEDE
jgi:putative solute:sodium symporter small subunit